MKLLNKLKARWAIFTDTILRFPLTIVMLLAATVTNGVWITSQENGYITKIIIALALGSLFYAVLQLLYERFFDTSLVRATFMGATVVFSFVYFFLIRKISWNEEVTVRTMVVVFILLIAFIWFPAIKSTINFNESFLAAFKGFFATIFLNGVLFLGVALILGAIDMLIIRIDSNAYSHSANVIFVFLAPIYFLCLIPFYPKKEELKLSLSKENNPEDTELERKEINIVSIPKFLETLISYVIIPITAVFTIILLLYIIMNITGDFWTNNLMEPLLVSYSITVIIVYLLVATLQNVFAKKFRRIFPKILIPVVLFQTISSVLRIGEVGITHGSYYAILFGVFATFTGVIFSVFPIRKNGIVAPVLIALSVLSILPPVDAFNVSRENQTKRLENALIRNNMWQGDAIKPNANISKKDQQIIVTSINYLNRMEYAKDIKWLSSYHKSLDFQDTFGFAEYDEVNGIYTSTYLNRDMNQPITINGYDYMVRMNIYSDMGDVEIQSFEKEGKIYTLRLDRSGDSIERDLLILEEKEGQELIRFEVNEVFNNVTNNITDKSIVNTDELTFTQENDIATLTLVADSISINESMDGKYHQVDGYILVGIK